MKPVNTRKKPSQARSKATVEAILKGSARVFMREGFDGASTNRIAQEAGVGVGSLYQYFPNKESIAAELIERHLGKHLGIMVDTLHEVADRPVSVAVPALVRSIFEAHRHEPELHRVLMEAGSRVGMDRRKREVITQFQHLTRVYLESHRSELSLTDLSLGSYVIVLAVDAVIREVVLAPPEYDFDEVIEAVAAMCLAHFGATSAPGEPLRGPGAQP